jgi:hypothetical protein
MLECEYQQFGDDTEEQKVVLYQNFKSAKELTSRIAPISRMPVEIQMEILLLVIWSAGNSRQHLMQVCRLWHAVIMGIPRLWSSLKLGVWTAYEQVEPILRRSVQWPLEVEIDTFDEIKSASDSGQRYRALAGAIPTMPRWKTLKLVTFSTKEGDGAIRDETGPASQLSGPLSCLESFTVLGPCPSSPFVDKMLSTISNTSMETLRSIQVPHSGVISRIVGHRGFGIFHNIVSLKVQSYVGPQEVEVAQLDLLPHMKCVEVLVLASVSLPDYPHSTTLPLVQTLQHLSLKATSMQWLFGRTLNKLQSCTIIFPRRVGPSGYEEVNLPSCKELCYDSHPFNALRYFLLPTITTLRLKINEWTTRRADRQLDWIRAELVQGQFTMVTTLSIDLVCFSEMISAPLSRLSHLQQFTLRVAEPTGLRCQVLRKLCAEPLIRSDKQEGVHCYSEDKKMGAWWTSFWPLLKCLRFEFKRWLRDADQTDIVPLFVAIAGTRTRLDVPLERFEVLVGEDKADNPPLELVADPLRAFSINGRCDHTHPEALEATISCTIFKTMESRSPDILAFLSQLPCRSILRKLRSLHLYNGVILHDPIDILPHLDSLEVLEAHGLHIPTCSLNTDLMLVRTLKRLLLRHTSIQWMMGRQFKKLEECSIWSPIVGSLTDARVIKMPICTRMLFGDRALELLGVFSLPSLTRLALVNPWFPDLPAFARRWTEVVGVISETIKVTSLDLEAGACHPLLITALGAQPRLEHLVLRIWGYDGLETLLSALSLDSDKQRYGKGSIEDNSGEDDIIMASVAAEAPLSLCPLLQSLELKLENLDYDKKRSTLLPFFKRIWGSRRSRGQQLRVFKISWQFGEREEQLAS